MIVFDELAQFEPEEFKNLFEKLKQRKNEKDLQTMEPLLSHGCYNQNIMKHCRPEHDYRIDTSAGYVEKTEENRHDPTCRNFRQVQNPLPHSVIPWMSP